MSLFGSYPVCDYMSAGYGVDLRSVHWKQDEVAMALQYNDLDYILDEHQAVSCSGREGRVRSRLPNRGATRSEV